MMNGSTYCVLLFLHICCCAQPGAQGADAETDLSLCQNLNIALVQNATTGIRLLLTTAMAHPSSELIDIPDYYLPPECGVDFHRCSVLKFQHSSIIYYVVPSVRSLIVISYTVNGANRTEPHKSVIPISESCNPTKAFYAGEDGRYRIFVACMDLPAGTTGTLRYLQYYFSPNGTQRGSVLLNTRALVKTETIYDTENVSEVVYLRGQQSCLDFDNLYFIDDSFVLHYPAESFDPQFEESSSRLTNCKGVPSVENFGDDRLLIRCYNGVTALYDTCFSQFTYPSPDREQVPYPCSNWNTVLYQNGSTLSLGRKDGMHISSPETITLPFSDFSYGMCIPGEAPMVVGVASDGAVFTTPLGANNVTKITQGHENCTGNNSISCYRPVFSDDDRRVFGAYDVDRREFLIVNLTVECKNHPSILHMNISATHFSPDLVSISSGDGSYNCTCQRELNIIDLVPTVVPSSSKSDHISSSDAASTTSSVVSSPAGQKKERNSQKTHIIIAVPVVVVVVVLAGVISAVVIVAVVLVMCRKNQKFVCNICNRYQANTVYHHPCGSDKGNMYVGTDNLVRNQSFHKSDVVDCYNKRSEGEQRDDLNGKIGAFNLAGM